MQSYFYDKYISMILCLPRLFYSFCHKYKNKQEMVDLVLGNNSDFNLECICVKTLFLLSNDNKYTYSVCVQHFCSACPRI